MKRNQEVWSFISNRLMGDTGASGNDFIDFEGTEFAISDSTIQDWQDEYNAIKYQVDEYIRKNDLDDIDDCKKIHNQFKTEVEKGLFEFSEQASLIDFKYYALKRAEEEIEKERIE